MAEFDGTVNVGKYTTRDSMGSFVLFCFFEWRCFLYCIHSEHVSTMGIFAREMMDEIPKKHIVGQSIWMLDTGR